MWRDYRRQVLSSPGLELSLRITTLAIVIIIHRHACGNVSSHILEAPVPRVGWRRLAVFGRPPLPLSERWQRTSRSIGGGCIWVWVVVEFLKQGSCEGGKTKGNNILRLAFRNPPCRSMLVCTDRQVVRATEDSAFSAASSSRRQFSSPSSSGVWIAFETSCSVTFD